MVQVNKAALKLFRAKSTEELISKMGTVFGEKSLELQKKHILAMWEKRDTFRSEATLCTTEGEEINVIFSLKIPKEMDDLKSIAVSLVDITERKKLERMQTEFVSTVSHELRTPLTSIKGSLAMLCDGVLGQLPERANGLLEIAANNTDRLIKLVNDILDIEKFEFGHAGFEFRPINLTEMVREAISSCLGYAAEYDVEFVLLDANSTIMVKGDPDRLVQVTANLLSNAAKFSQPGDIIKITISQPSPAQPSPAQPSPAPPRPAPPRQSAGVRAG